MAFLRPSRLDLDPAQRAAIDAKLARVALGPTPTAIRPRPAGAALPLSFAQLRLWFLSRLEPDSVAYSMTEAMALRGELDQAALAGALDRLIARHEILRTRYVERGGEPEQVVDPPGPAALVRVDLRAHGEEEARRRARQLIAEEAARPFDLARGPVVRALLARVADREHHFALNVHHIASDGWSHAILFDELARSYAALAAGREPDLPALPVQYGDYARWQRSWLDAERRSELIAYWRRALDRIGTLDLPLDRARPPRPRFTGGVVEAALPAELTGRLGRIAEAEGATTFMTLLAAWSAVLGGASGQEDFGVGTAIAGRTRVELESLLGFFVNTLVMRADLAGDPSFREVVRRTREAALGAFAHQDLPFEEVVDALGARRDPSANPLFQAAFVLQNAPPERHQFDRLEVSRLPLDYIASQFDMTLLVTDEQVSGRMVARLGYDDTLFDRSTAATTLDRFLRLLDAAASEPDLPLGRLDLASPAERARVAAMGAGPPLAHGPLLSTIAAHAARDPDALAVDCAGVALSRGELDRRANRLARRLLDLGVGREAVVASLVPRSVNAVVGLLACWKAGLVHVWLDPDWPAERIANVAADARVAAVIGSDPGGLVAPRVDPADPTLADLPPSPPSVEVDPDQLAYLIYTSGSTGRPKGVAATHRGIAALVAAQRELIALAPTDRMLLFASFSFDVSMAEIAVGLSAGVPIVMTAGETALPGAALAELVERSGVTYTNLTPSVLAALPRRDYPSLRTLISAGEALPPETLARWARPGRRIFNLYGPAEATSATAGPCVPDGRRPSVGTPHPTWRLYILDAAMQRVPVGVAGEIYLGGPNLARGYVGRPDLTSAGFVPDPFSVDPGGRMYRSGDQARWRPDGSIELLGRVDRQLKLHGVRIEPGEIEQVLRAHPQVADAAVGLARDPAGDPALVAYVVAAGEPRALRAALREHMRRHLPRAMVPGAIVLLDRLPALPSGKLDRRALPDRLERHADEVHAPPISELEVAIARAWQELLGIERVGLDDNFFEVGGNSLRLVQLQSRVEALSGRRLSLVEHFRYPTVRSLAAALAPARAATAPAPPAPRVEARPAGEPIALVGAAIRFPGAATLDQLWDTLCRGVESVRRFGRDELLAAGVPAEMVDHPSYVPAHGSIDGIEEFDAGFFGVTRREARLMDPQQRLLLECAWEALERSGHDPARYRIGLHAGASVNRYFAHHVAPQRELLHRLGGLQAAILTDSDYLATRAAYALGLRGPSFTVQTACSTGLVAVHLACQSLRAGECDVALAAGVSLDFPRGVGYLHREGETESSDGHCRAFDAAATGAVGGEGIGVVALRRLSDALADGDEVLAVVLGSALNNDGGHKMGFTAPSIEGQAEVIRAALAAAGVDPGSIACVEAHGSGTPLGDPIEVAALRQAFAGAAPGSVLIGTIKSNIGHLGQGAGMAGLVKAALMVQRGAIPPTLHVDRPHPALELEGSPLDVSRSLRGFPPGRPRRVGVSSFGLGGTNAHAILQEPPAAPAAEPSRRALHILTWSAQTARAVDVRTRELADLLAAGGVELADVAATLGRRRAFEHRRALVARSAGDAAAALASASRRRVLAGVAERPRRAAFLFPGAGSQLAGMGARLYQREPVYRETIDRAAEAVRGELERDLRELLFDRRGAELLGQPRHAQPAVLATSCALVRLLADRGVTPAVVLGHSDGELAAACAAGLWSLEQVMRMAAVRGRLIEETAPGAVASVRATPGELADAMGGGVELAAINGPRATAIAGPVDAIDRATRALAARGLDVHRIPVARGFHSALMDPILGAIGDLVAGVPSGALRLPWISSVTGAAVDAEEAGSPDYWRRGLRGCVQFAPAVERVVADPDVVLVEIGGGGLGSLVRAQAGASWFVPTLEAGAAELEEDQIAEAVASLWLHGCEVDREAAYRGERRRRLPLPTYPFERERHWIDAPGQVEARDEAPPVPERPAPAPSAPGELVEMITLLWQELLGADDLGPEHSVFAHGANSLIAAQMGVRLTEMLPVAVSSRTVLAAMTPTELARQVEALLVDMVEAMPESDAAAGAEHGG